MKALLVFPATLLLALVASPGEAQMPAQKPGVYSVPSSNRIIEGEISRADGKVVKFGVLEGGLLTFESTEGGSVAISGEIVDEGSRDVRFSVFEIESFGPGLQGLKRVGDLEVREGRPEISAAAKNVQVLVSKISPSPKLTEAEVQAFRQIAMESVPGAEAGNPVLATCCVTCGNTRTCGCKVSDTCGSCCTDPCCGGGTPNPDTRD